MAMQYLPTTLLLLLWAAVVIPQASQAMVPAHRRDALAVVYRMEWGNGQQVIDYAVGRRYYTYGSLKSNETCSDTTDFCKNVGNVPVTVTVSSGPGQLFTGLFDKEPGKMHGPAPDTPIKHRQARRPLPVKGAPSKDLQQPWSSQRASCPDHCTLERTTDGEGYHLLFKCSGRKDDLYSDSGHQRHYYTA
jgi:hypothetical protein